MWQNFLLLNSDRRGEACLDASILFPGMTFPIRSLPGSHHRVAPRALLLYLAAPSMICYPASALTSVCSRICGCSWRCCSDADRSSGPGTNLPTSHLLAPPQRPLFVCECWQKGHAISQSHVGTRHTDVSKVEQFINVSQNVSKFFVHGSVGFKKHTCRYKPHIAPCMFFLLGVFLW